jgi:hypothetical protein
VRLLALGLACCLASAGCGHTDVVAVVFRPPPQTVTTASTLAVPLYAEGQASPPVAQDLALVQVVSHGDEATLEHTAAALAARGATLGCEAIIRVRFAQGYARIHGVGVCVAFVH